MYTYTTGDALVSLCTLGVCRMDCSESTDSTSDVWTSRFPVQFRPLRLLQAVVLAVAPKRVLDARLLAQCNA
jgi:hypothetical protein